MQNIQVEIEARVNSMIGDVVGLIRTAAMESVKQALNHSLSQGTLAKKQQKQKGSPKYRTTLKPRRSDEEIASLSERLYREIEKAPGQTMDIYATFLAVPTKALSIPSLALKKSARVRSLGERNETKYFPMDRA